MEAETIRKAAKIASGSMGQAATLSTWVELCLDGENDQVRNRIADLLAQEKAKENAPAGDGRKTGQGHTVV